MKVLLELLSDVHRLLETMESLEDVRDETRPKLEALLASVQDQAARLQSRSQDPLRRASLFQRALEALAHGRFEEAKSILLAAHEEFPGDDEIITHLGLVSWELGEFSEAAQWYQQAMEAAFPEDFAGWQDDSCRGFLRAMEGRALACYKTGELDEALRLFDGLACANPIEFGGCRYLAGEIRHFQKDYSGAVAEYERVPFEPAVTYNLALAQFELGQIWEATATLIRGLAGNPHIAAMLLGRSGVSVPTTMGFTGSIEYAEEFVEACRTLWSRAPGSIEFLRRVFDHPMVRATLEERRVVLDDRSGHADARYALGALVRQVMERLDA